jgi:hypothetical protein
VVHLRQISVAVQLEYYQNLLTIWVHHVHSVAEALLFSW